MGRYTEKYWDNRTSPIEEGIAAIATAGLTLLMRDDDLAWWCEISDSETGVVGSHRNGKSSKAKAHAAAWENLLEKQADYYNEQKAKRKAERSSSSSSGSSSYSTTTTTGSNEDNFLVQLLAYVIGGIIILWLILAVALPLAVINSSFILLMIGVTNRRARKILYPLAFLTAIYLVFDYNKGGFTKLLSDNVSFLYKLVPFLFYSNVICGAIAAYLFIRDYIFRTYRAVTLKEEFTTQNSIVMACLLIAFIFVTRVPRFNKEEVSIYSQQLY